jgi:hypothetical protein
VATKRMGRPPKHPEDRADKLVSFRVTAAVYEYAQELAAKDGYTMSQWLNNLIGLAMERDLVERKPPPNA